MRLEEPLQLILQFQVFGNNLHLNFDTNLNLVKGLKKDSSRLRVDCWWSKSSVPEKFRKKDKMELENVKELLEADETN